MNYKLFYRNNFIINSLEFTIFDFYKFDCINNRKNRKLFEG